MIIKLAEHRLRQAVIIYKEDKEYAWLNVKEYLRHRWPWIWYAYRITIQSLSWLSLYFQARVTTRFHSWNKNCLFTVPEHLSCPLDPSFRSTSVVPWIRRSGAPQLSLGFVLFDLWLSVMFCVPLFVPVWHCIVLSFFNILLLIITLVSSNLSWNQHILMDSSS